jgi:hypothetical protein
MKLLTFELFKQHGAEAARQFGILWLVFALLDKVVAGAITVPWMIWNFLFSIAMWTAGMYIETTRK